MNLRELKTEEKNYTYSRSQEEEKVLPCIGHLRGDFGSTGNEFYSTWFEHNSELKTQEFSKEIDRVINDLRFGNEYGKLMASRDDMARYCYSHPDSRFEGSYTTEYGFRADTEKYSFLFRLNLNHGDYNFYCYCYEKETLDKHFKFIEKTSKPSVALSKGIAFVDLNKALVDFMKIENRRFMYHPSGVLILGAEDVFRGEDFSSHSEEFYEVCKLHEHELPPFDDFIQ